MRARGLVFEHLDVTELPRVRHRPYVGSTTETYPAGRRIAAHWHDEDQLIYVSSGLVAIHTVHGAWVASPGRAISIPAGVEHEHRIFARTTLHVHAFDSDKNDLAGHTPEVIGVDALLHQILIAITGEKLPVPEIHNLTEVMRDRLRRSTLTGLQLPVPRDPRLIEACHLVQTELSRPRTLPELAKEISTSERTLTRLFRTEFGQTYPQWRTRARIYRAMIELTDGSSVSDVARHCGWATTSAFVDSFRQMMGQTPGAFQSTRRPSTQ